MAKAVTIKVKLVSSADTGFYYVAKKNSRTMTEKLLADERELRNRIEQIDLANQRLKQAQERLIRSERLASVGKLAAGERQSWTRHAPSHTWTSLIQPATTRNCGGGMTATSGSWLIRLPIQCATMPTSWTTA